VNVATSAPFPDPDPEPRTETESVDSTLAEFSDEGWSPGVGTAKVETECYGAVVAIFDGPGDKTVRPARPSLRPYLGRHPRPEPPPPES
jgi:hypothetical protein